MKYRKEDTYLYFFILFTCNLPGKISTSQFIFRAGTMARLNNEQTMFMWDTGANRSGASSKSVMILSLL